MSEYDETDDMCPNCNTPWKCDGPHLVEQTKGWLDHKDDPPEPAVLLVDSDADVERLADILMDARVDSPWRKPPSMLTYQQASRKLAESIRAALRPDPTR